MSSLVTVDHIHKQHRLGDQTVHALSDVCLEIDRGEFVAVVGPSGSGKSTLLSILGCLDQPSCGRYHLNGEDVFAQSKSRLSELRNRRIGIVFQNFNLLPRLTALENVALPLFYRREPLGIPPCGHDLDVLFRINTQATQRQSQTHLRNTAKTIDGTDLAP